MITKVLLPCLFINCYENYNPQKFGAKKAMTKKCNWGPWDSIASFASLYYSEVTFYHINRHIQIGTQAVGKFLSLCYTTAHWEGNTWEGGQYGEMFNSRLAILACVQRRTIQKPRTEYSPVLPDPKECSNSMTTHSCTSCTCSRF